jgi:hypothetical protein
LEEWALVPVELQPFQGLQDRFDRFGRRSLPVGILDAEDKLAPMVAGKKVVEQSRACTSDVEVPGRAGSETGPNGGHERKLTGSGEGVNGTLPKVRPKPDSSYVAKMIQRGMARKGTEELQRRLFDTKPSTPPAESAPSEQKSEKKRSSREELIRKRLEGLFGR